MNPTRRDPCKVCGHGLIEHEGRPFDVTCSLCQIEGRKVPPPTVEWRRHGYVPYSAGLLLYTALVLLAGVLIGMGIRGGL